MSTDVLALKKIHKDFGAFHALTDVDLTVEKGKIYGFIGKNGAGKTTMMRIISGMSLPTSGSMELFGKSDPREVCRERARLGVMLEDRGILISCMRPSCGDGYITSLISGKKQDGERLFSLQLLPE